MSTHNIGFYEEISKIIFELSSNIIKYAPYFFSCSCVTGTSPAGLACLQEFTGSISGSSTFFHYWSVTAERVCTEYWINA